MTVFYIEIARIIQIFFTMKSSIDRTVRQILFGSFKKENGEHCFVL